MVDGYDVDAVDQDALAAALSNVWGVVAGPERYTRELFDRAPSLRVVMRTGVGFDGVDVEAATTHGVAVLTTPSANADAVADFTLALMLAGLRRLRTLDDAVRSGKWRAAGISGDLSGATVGVVGLGAVGRAVVRRLAGFGCLVIAAEPMPDLNFCQRWGIELAPLADLLPRVDVLTLHAPLTPDNHHLIGARELALLRPSCILVNTARGGLVDEAALVAALKSGRLAGAGLDVFESEPLPVDHPLAGLTNVTLSSHEASFTRRGITSILDAAVASLLDFSAGRLPEGCVNPQVLLSRRPQHD